MKSHLKVICSGRRQLEFPNICRKSLPRDSSHQQALVVSSSCCFLQSRPSSYPCASQFSQFMPSFSGNPFHKQHPAFAFGYERKGLGNSGWMIALPWSQQLVISPSSLCIIYSLCSKHIGGMVAVVIQPTVQWRWYSRNGSLWREGSRCGFIIGRVSAPSHTTLLTLNSSSVLPNLLKDEKELCLNFQEISLHWPTKILPYYAYSKLLFRVA